MFQLKRADGKPKFFILKRKWLTFGAAALCAAAIFCAVNVPTVVSASVATRQLPIYCVERDQKVCSISFDAAWGDVRVRQLFLSQILGSCRLFRSISNFVRVSYSKNLVR